MPRGVYRRAIRKKQPKPTTKPKSYMKTCPICAETFKAQRGHARFCSDTCNKRNERGSIPPEVQAKADALRTERTARAAKAKVKRDADKAHQKAYRAILEKARELHLATYEQQWNEAIADETDPIEKAEFIRIRDEGLANIAAAASVPEPFMKTARDGEA